MLPEGLVLDEKVVNIAKMVAQSVIIKRMHDDGVMACNPEWITKEIEESWPDYLFCTGTMVHVVGQALEDEISAAHLGLATHCQKEATRYLNSLPIMD